MTIVRFAAQAVALLLTVGSSQAATFDYPEGGLHIDIAGDYVFKVEPGVAPLKAIIFITKPDLADPFIPDFRSVGCVISHWADPALEGLAQAEINAMAPPAKIENPMVPPGAMIVVSTETFDHKGITGFQVVYHLPLSVIAQTHLVDILLATPRGRFSFACGAAEETLDQAIPGIRGMLDGVTFLP
jgi:hypothetical protein